MITAGKDAASEIAGRPTPRGLRKLLLMTAVLTVMHLLVAAPHFAVRLLRGSPVEAFIGVEGFARVTENVWRGAAPSPEGYAALADGGVVAVIDLRAEAEPTTSSNRATEAGLAWIHIPIRDGQTPTAAQLAEIRETITAASGPVFVHCQAGVGRTGSVIAALQAGEGHAPGVALIEALRFGPLTLEQQTIIARFGHDHPATALLAVTAASRNIDSPRRFWSQLTG